MAKIVETIHKQCPNCGVKWTLREFDWQECDTCNYPDDDTTAQRIPDLEDYQDFDDDE